MNNKPLFWLIRKIKKRIPAIIGLTAAQTIHALFGVLFALQSRDVIDSAVSGNKEIFWNACIRQAEIILVILISYTVLRHMKEKLTADLDRDWKQDLLHSLLHGEYAAVSGFHSAELINRLSNDVRKVNEGILTIIPSTAAMITNLIAAVTVLGVIDIRFAVLIVLIGGSVICATGILRGKLKKLNKSVSEHDGRVSGFQQEVLEKLLMVQSMDVSGEIEQRANVLLAERYAVQRKKKNVSVAANTSVNLMAYGISFISLVWCSFGLLRGQMTVGALTAIIQLVNQLKAPFVNLSSVFPLYTAAVASAERLMEISMLESEPALPLDSPEKVYDQLKCIKMENVTFAYDRETILENAVAFIPKGTFSVIVGPSGKGKSTLLKLMLGVFKSEQGNLLLDLGDCALPIDRSMRRMFAYVPQGNLLLSGSLRDNLTIIKPDATDKEIEYALYISAMDEFLPDLPNGLDTVLGESGAGLSEGQAQRLAIARAVLGEAPILLLDECTSALDAETERKVLLRLKDMPNRTCVAITHRPAAIELCDFCLEIQDKKIHIKDLCDSVKTTGNCAEKQLSKVYNKNEMGA